MVESGADVTGGIVGASDLRLGEPGRMVNASPLSPTGPPIGGGAVGGGVWTPVAVVRTRPALQRGQLCAETGISLPQRAQNMGIIADCVQDLPMIA
jgi:hypothetical protein